MKGKAKGDGKGGNSSRKTANSVEQHQGDPAGATASGLDLCTITIATPEPEEPSDSPARTRSRSRETRPGPRFDASRSRTTSPQTHEQRELRAEEIDTGLGPFLEEPEAGDEEEEVVEEEQQEASSVSAGEPTWICCNLDTGASVTVFPKAMFEDMDPVGLRLKTASGEVVQSYGNGYLRGEDTRGIVRKLNGQVADVHKVLVSAGQMHSKGYTTWLHQGGGEIIPSHHPVNKALEKAYREAVARFGKEGFIPVLEENGVYNFYLREKPRGSGDLSPISPADSPPHEMTSEVRQVPRRAGQVEMTSEVRQVPRRAQYPPRETELACAVEDEPEVVEMR